MAVRHHVNVRNARLDAIETTLGTSPILELRSGARPTNITDADTGTLLASITLPSDWAFGHARGAFTGADRDREGKLAAASGGTKSFLGTWQDLTADNTGTFGHYRLKTSGGVCYEDGTVSGPGGGGDIVMDSATVTAGQQVSITSFSKTEGNA